MSTRLLFLSLVALVAGCGMGNACEELADARCDCDESMCSDDEDDQEYDSKRLQACKEELEDFECASD